MNKDEFNTLEVLKQIDYINKQLENNKSITGICKTLGVGRSTIRDRFKKLNYTYDKEVNAYILKENNDCNTDVIGANNGCNTDVVDADNRCSTAVGSAEITEVHKEEEVFDIIEKSDDGIKNNLLELAKNYELLKEIIDIHRSNKKVIKQQIIIDLEEADSKLVTTRINKKIFDEFNKFCDNNKQFRKVDLLSQAIKNFIDQHTY